MEAAAGCASVPQPTSGCAPTSTFAPCPGRRSLTELRPLLTAGASNAGGSPRNSNSVVQSGPCARSLSVDVSVQPHQAPLAAPAESGLAPAASGGTGGQHLQAPPASAASASRRSQHARGVPPGQASSPTSAAAAMRTSGSLGVLPGTAWHSLSIVGQVPAAKPSRRSSGPS